MPIEDCGRPLTDAEILLAQPMFGSAIDYGRVLVHRRRWWPLQPRNIAMAPDGDLWFHPASDLWHTDFATAPTNLKALFLHEMTHVLQAQRGGRWFLPLARHPFCRYRYRLVRGKPFRRYGLEQQAEIVRHCWLARERGAADPLLEALVGEMRTSPEITAIAP